MSRFRVLDVRLFHSLPCREPSQVLALGCLRCHACLLTVGRLRSAPTPKTHVEWGKSMSSTIGRRIVRQTAAVLLIVLVLPIAALGQTTRLTFLHTNDTYEIVATRGWGGFAQLMTVLKEQRAASAHSLTTF